MWGVLYSLRRRPLGVRFEEVFGRYCLALDEGFLSFFRLLIQCNPVELGVAVLAQSFGDGVAIKEVAPAGWNKGSWEYSSCPAVCVPTVQVGSVVALPVLWYRQQQSFYFHEAMA